MGRNVSQVPKQLISDRCRDYLERETKEHLGSLTPEALTQYRQELAKLAGTIGLCADEDTGVMLITSDHHQIDSTIRQRHQENSLRNARLAVDLSILREPEVAKQVAGGSSPKTLNQTWEARTGFSSQRAKRLADAGDVIRSDGKELTEGVEGEPGIPVEDLARKICKIPFYPKVKARIGARRAIAEMKKSPVDRFKRLITTDDPDIIVTPESLRAKEERKAKKVGSSVQGGRPVTQPLEPQNEQELAIRIHVQFNRNVYIASSRYEECLTDITQRLDAWREEKDEQSRLDHMASPALSVPGQYPFNDDVLTCTSGVELQNLIMQGNKDLGRGRLTVAVGTARLDDEPQFQGLYSDGHEKRLGFVCHARDVLGIGEDLRDILRVGRNIIKHPSFLVGQDGLVTDSVFYSLRFLDQAWINHKGDAKLIRARIASLSSREFALFASDPDYDLHGPKRALTRRQVEDYYILQEQLNELLDQGYAVKIVELYSKDERQVLRQMIEDSEKKYEARQKAAAAQSSASTPSSEASDGPGSAEILGSTVPLYENEKFSEDNVNKAA
jgi:hypothetical protein